MNSIQSDDDESQRSLPSQPSVEIWFHTAFPASDIQQAFFKFCIPEGESEEVGYMREMTAHIPSQNAKRGSTSYMANKDLMMIHYGDVVTLEVDQPFWGEEVTHMLSLTRATMANTNGSPKTTTGYLRGYVIIPTSVCTDQNEPSSMISFSWHSERERTLKAFIHAVEKETEADGRLSSDKNGAVSLAFNHLARSGSAVPKDNKIPAIGEEQIRELCGKLLASHY